MFWPITHWFAQTTHEQSRILHALIVLLLACVLLVKFSGTKIEAPFRLNSPARNALYLSFGILLLQFFGRFFTESPYLSLLGIPAYCSGFAAVLLFVFGNRTRDIVVTATSTFGVFIFLSTLMDRVDWPLRTLAGQCSGWVLNLMGKTVQLGVRDNPGDPAQLILLVDKHPFHVASECNGFGVITTCLLLAVLLSIYRRLKPLQFLISLVAGIALGFAFNTIRIICIVLLAPSMMEHYHLMHEIIGTISYWAALIITWKLLHGPTDYEPNS